MAIRRLVILHLALAVVSLSGGSCSSSGGGGGGDRGQDGGEDSPARADGVTGLGAEELPHYDEIPPATVPAQIRNQQRSAGRDLSELTPTPRYQGLLNSCVGFSTAYGLMTYLAATHVEGWADLDTPERQFSPAFVFNQANSAAMGRPGAAGKRCDQVGAYLADALMLLRDTGCATWHDMPYDSGECDAQPAAAVLSAAGDFRIERFDKTDTDVETVRSFLDQGVPTIAVLRIGPGFYQLGAEDIYDQADTATADLKHAVLVVGYEIEPATIKIMNSWGTEWGNGGYGRISAEIWPDVASELWVVENGLLGPTGTVSQPTGAKGQTARQPADAGWCAVSPKLDTDGDGYTDLIEQIFGLDPQTPDENPDFVDRPDADRDGYPDTTEVVFGTDTRDASDFPFDCDYAFPAGFFDEGDGGDDGPVGRLTAVVHSQKTGGRGGVVPGSVVVLEVNGDGNPDVAVANTGGTADGEEGTVSVLLGNGDGTLAEPLTIEGLAEPEFLTAVDLNGDDAADLAVGSSTSDEVTFLQADGAGGYAVVGTLELNHYLSRPMLVVDLDGDGQDELLSRHNEGVDIYAAEAGGLYTWLREVVLQHDAEAALVGSLCTQPAADFNGDGLVDLANTTLRSPTSEDIAAGDLDYALSLSIWLGAEDGLSFTRTDVLEVPVPYEQFSQLALTCPVVGEFNGDGRPDLAGYLGEDQGMFLIAGTAQGAAPVASAGNRWLRELSLDSSD